MRKIYPWAMLALALGCSGGPSRVTPPSIDADDAASVAMEQYDKDGDGAIAGGELDAAPALKASLATLDANKDGSVQEEEIVSRIESWQASGIGATMIQTLVSLDGRPLANANVTFEPEPFLGPNVKKAEGVTTSQGAVSVSVPKAERGSPDWPPGVQLGFYKIRVTKSANGKEVVPAKYNTETTLGQQIAPDDPALLSQLIKLELSSK